MPPAHVKPYEKRGKTDTADAETICKAVTRPTMRFLPVKMLEQQGALSMHHGHREEIRAHVRYGDEPSPMMADM